MANRMSRAFKPKPWSKLKSRIEGLFAPGLPLAIHCNAFAKYTNHDSWQEGRHWIVLEKIILWDFPGPAMREPPYRNWAFVPYAYEGYSGPGGSVVSRILRAYLDRPVADLMAPFPEDRWELVDMLRAADRRIGKERLLTWAKGLDAEHPAHAILRHRFGP